MTNEWPPSYDQDQLENTLKQLLDSGRIYTNFYESAGPFDGICQGDILRSECEFPFLDRDGDVASLDAHHPEERWFYIGNTCDQARSISDVPVGQVVRIIHIGSLAPELLKSVRDYKTAKLFFLPPWLSRDEGPYAASFIWPASISRHALHSRFTVEARLNQSSWYLLNMCIIRYMARSDGRHSP